MQQQQQQQKQHHHHVDFPVLQSILKLGGPKDQDNTTWYDCKFYPYAAPDHPPVFAVTGGRHTVICRCVQGKENAVDVLRWFKDDDPNALLNSVCWSRADNGDPLVCVTGVSTLVKVLNVKTGKVVTTLAGHGESINDLAISPIDPYLLATASKDRSIRIWSLDPAHEKQRTAAICHGEGHREEVLAIGFHHNGRYLLSGGNDNMVNLWHIPEIQKGGTLPDKSLSIHYPHFSSTEVHFDYVDCIQFYNDLIISRQAREGIIIWKIDHFTSSSAPPPPPIPTSTAFRSTRPIDIPASSNPGTRSAWGGRFQRLLSLHTPHIQNEFYLRFGLFHAPGLPPVLAAGDFAQSQVFFWDLQHLEEAGVGEPVALPRPEPPTTATAASALDALRQPSRSQSVLSNDSSMAAGPSSGAGRGKKRRKTGKKDDGARQEKAPPDQGIGDPYYKIPAHEVVVLQKYMLVGRQVAWSRDGRWCVITGDYGILAVFRRERTGEAG